MSVMISTGVLRIESWIMVLIYSDGVSDDIGNSVHGDDDDNNGDGGDERSMR